jgi:hypothetical protein
MWAIKFALVFLLIWCIWYVGWRVIFAGWDFINIMPSLPVVVGAVVALLVTGRILEHRRKNQKL